MEKHLNFILNIYSVLLYGLIIYIECIFLLPYKRTDLFYLWLCVFIYLDWLYVRVATKKLNDNGTN